MTTPRDNIGEEDGPAPNPAHTERFMGPIGRHYRADGTLVYPLDLTPSQLERLEAVHEAWRYLKLTGDRSHLIELGILPADDEVVEEEDGTDSAADAG